MSLFDQPDYLQPHPSAQDDAPEPEIACGECHGRGEVRVSKCSHGACPCGETVTRDCEECDGDGRARCGEMGCSNVAAVTDDGDKLCRQCFGPRLLARDSDARLAESYTVHHLDGFFADGTDRRTGTRG